jgi:hypothetical protein
MMYQTLIRHLRTDTEPHALSRSENDRGLLFETDTFRLCDIDRDGGEVVTPPKRGASSSLTMCALIERCSREYVSSFVSMLDCSVLAFLDAYPLFVPPDSPTLIFFSLIFSLFAEEAFWSRYARIQQSIPKILRPQTDLEVNYSSRLATPSSPRTRQPTASSNL